jgi:hypothetical protein
MAARAAMSIARGRKRSRFGLGIGLGLAMAGAIALPASAGLLTQTLSYSQQGGPWQHAFAFNPFMPSNPGDKLTGISLIVNGTQATSNGILDCVFGGSAGLGLGTNYCNGSYYQDATFSLVSPSGLTGVSSVTVQQTGAITNVLEDDAFKPLGNAVPLSASSVSGSTTYANNIAAYGGTLDPNLFGGLDPIDLVFRVDPSSGAILPQGGVAGASFDTINYSLNVTLVYDFVSTAVAEPGSLFVLTAGLLSLAAFRRRQRT